MLDIHSIQNENTIEKSEMGEAIIGKFVMSADAYNEYITKPRKYGTDDLLYMREAHFIQSVGRLVSSEIGAIAKSLGVTAGAASQTAAKLEAKGLITREKSNEDSRVVIVKLTDKAKQINEFHEKLDFEEYSHLSDKMNQFDEKDFEKIYKFLDIINEFFDKNRKKDD